MCKIARGVCFEKFLPSAENATGQLGRAWGTVWRNAEVVEEEKDGEHKKSVPANPKHI